MTMKQKIFLRREGITLEGFAKMIGVSRSTAAKWNTGHRTPPPAQLKVISKKTKGAVEPDDYLNLKRRARG